MKTKKCSKCGELKLVSEYYKKTRARDGLAPRCKICSAEDDRKNYLNDIDLRRIKAKTRYENNKPRLNAISRAYNIEHKEENSARRKQFRKDNLQAEREKDNARRKNRTPEQIAAKKSYDVLYSAVNKTKKNARSTAHHAANKEQCAKNSAQWKRNNPDKVAAHGATRKTKKTEAGGFFTDEDVAQMKIKQHGECIYCHTSILEVNEKDHMTSVANFGSSWPRNMVLLCEPCNGGKWKRNLAEYLLHREKLGLYTKPSAYEILDIESTPEYLAHRELIGGTIGKDLPPHIEALLHKHLI